VGIAFWRWQKEIFRKRKLYLSKTNQKQVERYSLHFHILRVLICLLILLGKLFSGEVYDEFGLVSTFLIISYPLGSFFEKFFHRFITPEKLSRMNINAYPFVGIYEPDKRTNLKVAHDIILCIVTLFTVTVNAGHLVLYQFINSVCSLSRAWLISSGYTHFNIVVTFLRCLLKIQFVRYVGGVFFFIVLFSITAEVATLLF